MYTSKTNALRLLICLVLVLTGLLSKQAHATDDLDYLFFQSIFAPDEVQSLTAKIEILTKRPPLTEKQKEQIIPTLIPSFTGKNDPASLDQNNWQLIHQKLEEIDKHQREEREFISITRLGGNLRFSYHRNLETTEKPYLTFISPLNSGSDQPSVSYRIDNDGRNAMIQKANVGFPVMLSDFYRMPTSNKAIFKVALCKIDGELDYGKLEEVVRRGFIGSMPYKIEQGPACETMNTILFTMSIPGFSEQDFNYSVLVLRDCPDVLVEMISKAGEEYSVIRNSKFQFRSEIDKPIPSVHYKAKYRGTDVVHEKTVILHDLSINEPIDEKTFAFAPPAGYTVTDCRYDPPIVNKPVESIVDINKDIFSLDSTENKNTKTSEPPVETIDAPNGQGDLISQPMLNSTPVNRTPATPRSRQDSRWNIRVIFVIGLLLLAGLSFIFSTISYNASGNKSESWLLNRKIQWVVLLIIGICIVYLAITFLK